MEEAGKERSIEKYGIELEEAVEIIRQNAAPVEDTEEIPLLLAGGRILAEEIRAGFDYPPFPRSPLDGYAFSSASSMEACETSPVTLKIAAYICAGDFFDEEIKTGEAARIMTGAPIPQGCDCVIRQEDVTAEDGTVSIPHPLRVFENYCFQGEDFKMGEVLLEKGIQLKSAELGIAASAGREHVKVYRCVRAALFVTGDEVVMPGMPLSNGLIYDSNLHMLAGRIKELGMELIEAEHLADDPDEVAAAIRDASKKADVIFTTGGVSVGDKDIFHQVLPLLSCKRFFWKVNIKPGTPAMFSMFQNVPMLNLSGNPFAAATSFELLARPLLEKISRNYALNMIRTDAILTRDFAKASPVRRFIRGKFYNQTVTIPSGKKHSSGILSSMSQCNCLVEIVAGAKPLREGDRVKVWLL